jgi:hypothetical protein
MGDTKDVGNEKGIEPTEQEPKVIPLRVATPGASGTDQVG